MKVSKTERDEAIKSLKKLQIDVNKVIGRIGDEYIVCHHVFDHGSFRGAVGSMFHPITNRESEMVREQPEEELEELWLHAVECRSTAKGLNEWAFDYYENNGDSAFWDLSYYDMGAKCAELYNGRARREAREGLEEGEEVEIDKDDLAEFSECVGGGRMFENGGCHKVKWQDFDELFVGQDVLDLIDQYETTKGD